MGLCLKCIVEGHEFDNTKVIVAAAVDKKKVPPDAPATKKHKGCEAQGNQTQEILSLPTGVLVCLIGIV